MQPTSLAFVVPKFRDLTKEELEDANLAEIKVKIMVMVEGKTLENPAEFTYSESSRSESFSSSM